VKENTRLMLQYVSAATVLTAAIIAADYQSSNDSMEEHRAFFSEMRSFMGKGGRNTAEEGYLLCLRIQHLEGEHHAKSHPRTCADIYRIDK